MGRKRTGTLVKNRLGSYYLRVMVGGKWLYRSTGTRVLRDAEKKRQMILEELGVTTHDAVEVLTKVRDRLESAEVKKDRITTIRDADRDRRDMEAQRMALDMTWDAYLKAATKPDTGPEAQKQYEYVWRQLIDWLQGEMPKQGPGQEVKHLADLTPTNMQEYLQYLKQRPLAPKSLKNHLAVIRLVLKNMPETESLDKDLFAWYTPNTITMIETHRQEIPLAKLAEVCDKAEGELKLLFFLGIYTGMRLKDCALLPWDDVNLDRKVITHVAYKLARRNDEPLRVPIHADLLPMLQAIPQEARTGYVLPETAAQYQTRSCTVTDRIQRHLINCGLQTHHKHRLGERPAIKFGFHSFRHSVVSMWQDAGAAQSAVMELVGHHSRAMTMKYTHTSEKQLRHTVNLIPSLSRAALPAPGGTGLAPLDSEALLNDIRGRLDSATPEQLQKIAGILTP